MPGCLSVILFKWAAILLTVAACTEGSLCSSNPTGTDFSIAARNLYKLSGRVFAFRDKRTAFMPQPISTPTAAGTIAPRMGITEPTVAPIPACTSGIAAICE